MPKRGERKLESQVSPIGHWLYEHKNTEYTVEYRAYAAAIAHNPESFLEVLRSCGFPLPGEAKSGTVVVFTAEYSVEDGEKILASYKLNPQVDVYSNIENAGVDTKPYDRSRATGDPAWRAASRGDRCDTSVWMQELERQLGGYGTEFVVLTPLEKLRRTVHSKAKTLKGRHGWCVGGTNEVLRSLGLPDLDGTEVHQVRQFKADVAAAVDAKIRSGEVVGAHVNPALRETGILPSLTDAEKLELLTTGLKQGRSHAAILAEIGE